MSRRDEGTTTKGQTRAANGGQSLHHSGLAWSALVYGRQYAMCRTPKSAARRRTATSGTSGTSGTTSGTSGTSGRRGRLKRRRSNVRDGSGDFLVQDVDLVNDLADGFLLGGQEQGTREKDNEMVSVDCSVFVQASRSWRAEDTQGMGLQTPTTHALRIW